MTRSFARESGHSVLSQAYLFGLTFVMGLLVAYMAGKATGKSDELLIMSAQLEPGFYFFLAYCLFSIAATTLLREPAAIANA